MERLLVNGFIVLMLFILWAWDLPEASLLNRLVSRLRSPIQWLGLGHSWRMFSPDPMMDNCRLQFKLRLADGTAVAIEPEYFRYPEVQRGPVPCRWAKIKINLLRTGTGPLRRSICHYVAAEFLARSTAEFRQPAKRPVEVQIIRWRQPIAPFEAGDAAPCGPYKGRIVHTQPLRWASPNAVSAEVVIWRLGTGEGKPCRTQ